MRNDVWQLLIIAATIAASAILNSLWAQSISVQPGTMSLGTKNSADFVIAGPVSVSFNKGSWSNYTLRVFTQNTDGQPGLVGQTDANFKLPFKVWTANYGPTGTMPDPAANGNWVNYWYWVPDKAEMTSSNRFSWRRLTWVGPGDDASVGSPFDVYFAFDLEKDGYTFQSYAGTVYFELIDKYDNDSGAQSVAATFAMDISLNFALDGSISLDTGSMTQITAMQTTDTRTLVSGTLFATVKATGLRSYNPNWDCNALSIRVYTDNHPEDTSKVLSGLAGQSNPAQSVPVKVWTPNFGAGIDNDSDGIPDVDNDLNWKSDSNAVWIYVFDRNLSIRENTPWNYSLFDYTDLIKLSALHPTDIVPPGVLFENPARDGSDGRLPVYFALTLDAKAAPQTYKSMIYVELGVSTDFGSTFSSFVDSLELTVNLQAATPLITLTSDKTALTFPALSPFSQRNQAQDNLTLSLDARGLDQYDAIALRMLTDNGVDANGHVRLGMKGSLRPDWTVPLRVWTLNYGLGVDANGDGVADIDNDDNWQGGDEKTVWVYLLDNTEPAREDWSHITDPSDPFYDGQNAWGRPLFDFTELYRWSDYHDRKDQNGDFVYHVSQHLRLIDRTANGGDDQRVTLYFAADFTDALPQDYQTTVQIEAVFSADGGYTVARKETLAVTVSATVPAGSGDQLAWLQNRVDMRPDLDGSVGTVKRLPDSQQDENDLADTGFIYDAALMIMALTRAGDFTRAQAVMNALQYLQNNDGSFFFSYMTRIDDDQINEWASTDTDNNGKPDELETRVNWSADHGLDSSKQQLKSWAYQDFTSTVSPQTQTTLPHKILYRTIDFRKFAGTNAWLALALIYYEKISGDNQYRPVLDGVISYLKSIQQMSQATATDSLDYGGIRLGRGFFFWVDQTVNGYDGPGVDGFINLRSYSTEHNLDTYAAFRYYADLTGDLDAKDRAALIKDFIFRNLWAPGVNTTQHPEAVGEIENCFFVGFDMTESGLSQNPAGLIDTAHFLDAQSWAVLAFGPDVAVNDKGGAPGTLDMVLDFLDATDNRTWLDFNNNPIPPRPFLKVTGQTIYSGTAATVSGIDGYKESARDRYYQTAVNITGDFVWSEGSEGVVAARYLAGDSAIAGYFHAETNSYALSNGGVPYSTLGVPDSAAFIGKELWSFGNNAAIAGTAWFLFNEPDGSGQRFNPFQPYELPPDPVFSEDFQAYAAGQQPNASDWQPLIAASWFWEAVSDNGSMWMKGFSNGAQMLEIKAASPADFTLTSDIRFPSTTAHQAGLFFRKQDNNNYYAFYLEEGQSATSTWAAVFGKWQGGGFSKLAGAGIGETIATGKTYRVKVEGNGSTFKCYVDKGSGYTLILTVTDNTFASGTLGLRGYFAGHTRWDNVTLYDVPGAGLNKQNAPISRDANEGDAHLPGTFVLQPNYPNPFNPSTQIRFQLPQPEKVRLEIFDISGRRVRTLIDAPMAAGEYHATWQGRDDNNQPVASGIYFLRLQAGRQVALQKAVLLK